jgi:hypothetical protein
VGRRSSGGTWSRPPSTPGTRRPCSTGRTNPGLFDGCEQRHGDREQGDYASLADGAWDAVIDVNTYYPRAVRQAMGGVE